MKHAVLTCLLTLFGWGLASGCDITNAALCFKGNLSSIEQFRVNCDRWAYCSSEYQCTPETFGVPSDSICRDMEACAPTDFLDTANCLDTNKCSGLRQCLNAFCPAIGDWQYSQYCPKGVVDFCNANASIDMFHCLFTYSSSEKNCSEQIECAKPHNCHVVPVFRGFLAKECLTLLDNSATGRIPAVAEIMCIIFLMMRQIV